MAVLEALFLGAAVVARRVGGIPEVIEDGVTGILVDSSEPQALAEACLRVLVDDALRGDMVLAGTNRVADKFSAEHSATETIELYRSLCGVK